MSTLVHVAALDIARLRPVPDEVYCGWHIYPHDLPGIYYAVGNGETIGGTKEQIKECIDIGAAA